MKKVCFHVGSTTAGHDHSPMGTSRHDSAGQARCMPAPTAATPSARVSDFGSVRPTLERTKSRPKMKTRSGTFLTKNVSDLLPVGTFASGLWLLGSLGSGIGLWECQTNSGEDEESTEK